MQRIGIDEVQPPTIADVFNASRHPTLEGLARIVLGASKGDGKVNEAIREAVSEFMAQRHSGAALALGAMIPDHIAPYVLDDTGAISPGFGILWLTDGAGVFAAVVPGLEISIGRADEFVQLLAGAAARAARSVSTNPEVSDEARYEAALFARPRLTTIK